MAGLVAALAIPALANGSGGPGPNPSNQQACQAMYQACQTGNVQAMTQACPQMQGQGYGNMTCLNGGNQCTGNQTQIANGATPVPGNCPAAAGCQTGGGMMRGQGGMMGGNGGGGMMGGGMMGGTRRGMMTW